MTSTTIGGLRCHDWGGAPGAPALLLLHGFSDSGRCWVDAVDHWTTDFHVLTVDARGHGQSERFTPSQLASGPQAVMVEDIVQLLDSWPALTGRPVALVGHSMGGGVACEVALARPDRVAAVVLEDPALGPSDGTTAGHEGAVRREWGDAQVAQLTRYAVDPALLGPPGPSSAGATSSAASIIDAARARVTNALAAQQNTIVGADEIAARRSLATALSTAAATHPIWALPQDDLDLGALFDSGVDLRNPAVAAWLHDLTAPAPLLLSLIHISEPTRPY